MKHSMTSRTDARTSSVRFGIGWSPQDRTAATYSRNPSTVSVLSTRITRPPRRPTPARDRRAALRRRSAGGWRPPPRPYPPAPAPRASTRGTLTRPRARSPLRSGTPSPPPPGPPSAQRPAPGSRRSSLRTLLHAARRRPAVVVGRHTPGLRVLGRGHQLHHHRLGRSPAGRARRVSGGREAFH